MTKSQRFAAMAARRGIEFARIGMRISVNGRNGKIVGSNHADNLDVRFDGYKHISNCHPTWETRYFADDGSVLASFCEGETR